MQSQHVTSNDWLYSTKKIPNPSSISIPQLAGITFQLRVGQEHIAQRSPGTHSWKIDGGSKLWGLTFAELLATYMFDPRADMWSVSIYENHTLAIAGTGNV